MTYKTEKLIPPHGGYRKLKSYQAAEIVYDFTVAFCKTYLSYKTYGSYTRTVDQMTQAARSGKQNIAEGSVDSGTSKKTELKLVGVARGSLEELLLDFEDFLRQKGLKLWGKNDPRAQEIRELAYKSNRSYKTYESYMSSPEAAANAAICLIHQANFLLDKQLQSLEKEFLEKGGFTERLYKHRSNKSNRSYKTYILALFALASLALATPASAANSSIFTISAWVKPASSIAAKAIVAKAEEVRLVTDASGNPVCQIKNATWQTAAASSVAISLNSWSYVTCSYDKTTLKIFVNGSQTGSSALTVVLDNTTAALKFGADDSGASVYGEFAGVLDDIKFYNYARTSSQIIEDYSAGAGRKQPIAHWKFDEGYGITANNSGIGGSALNGAMTNFAAPATADSGWTNSGKLGKALKFDGTDDVATITNSTAIDLNDNLNAGFTIMGWVNADTAGEGSGGQIFWKGANNYLRVDSLSAGRLDIEGKLDLATTDANLNLSSAIATGAWNHIAMSYDGAAKITLWLNGVNKGSNTGSGATAADTFNLLIGGTTTDNFDGAIDDFKVYSYELTEDEVREEYNSGVATKLGSTGTSSAGVADDSASRAYCIPGDTSTCNPPVGYWNFDEGTGSTVNDISGNANTGTWAGTGSHWTTGKIGKGGSFNGSNDYVDAGVNNLDLNKVWTRSLWIKRLSDSGAIEYVSTTSSQYSFGYQVRILANDTIALYFQEGGGAYRQYTLPSASVINVGVWYFATFTFDGTYLKVYINGNNEANSIDLSGYIDAAENMNQFGRARSTGSSYGYGFSGSIDEVRIYNYARTPAQIAWDYNRGKPVAEWKFDECQGNIANDASGNGNTGTITIGATAPQTGLGTCAGVNTANAWYNGRNGKINSAMSFDGTDDYAGVADSNALDLTSFTLSSWVKINQYKLSGIISKGSPGPDTSGKNINYAIGIDASGYGGVAFEETNGTDHTLSSVSVLPLNTWAHFAGSYDYSSGIFKIYINGKLDAQETEGTFQPELNAQMVGIANGILDGVPTAGYYFNGLIDDVKIYNYALTAEQVKMEYNGGAVNFR